MKFLVKDPGSPLRAMRYASGGHNEALLAGLLQEQKGFCAYTEKRVSGLDTRAVEHFDRSLKGTDEDGYHNVYGTLQSSNQWKRRKERRYQGASFFNSRFFQLPGDSRLSFSVEDMAYEPTDPADGEARDLIDYLGLNSEELVKARRRHVESLQERFFDAGWRSPDQQLRWFEGHPEDLSFITALEGAMQLDLAQLLSR